MIYSGACSVTFRQLKPEEIVDLVVRAGLDVIEWGGDVHVPHGDVHRARQVQQMTADAGIRVASYGSYYTLAGGEKEEPDFSRVLETAVALGAPMIRVWAGDKGSANTDETYRQLVVDETCRIADLAATEDIAISYEFHSGTLTDSEITAKSTW